MQMIGALFTLLVILIAASVAVEHMLTGLPFKGLLLKYAHLWGKVFIMAATALFTCLAVIAVHAWKGFPSLVETWKRHKD